MVAAAAVAVSTMTVLAGACACAQLCCFHFLCFQASHASTSTPDAGTHRQRRRGAGNCACAVVARAAGSGCVVGCSGVTFFGAAGAREQQRAAKERGGVPAPGRRRCRVPCALLVGDMPDRPNAADDVVVWRAEVAPARAERQEGRPVAGRAAALI